MRKLLLVWTPGREKEEMDICIHILVYLHIEDSDENEREREWWRDARGQSLGQTPGTTLLTSHLGSFMLRSRAYLDALSTYIHVCDRDRGYLFVTTPMCGSVGRVPDRNLLRVRMLFFFFFLPFGSSLVRVYRCCIIAI